MGEPKAGEHAINYPGRFLDIGAYNPKAFSNTRALFERGWSGVMVEPSPGPFLDLVTEYGNCDRVELVCGAIGIDRKLVRFHWNECGTGTSNESHYQKWRDRTKYEGRFFAPQITLPELFTQFGHDFDFVNIDVEGNSAELFACLMQIRPACRPKCFCVEHDGQHEAMTIAALKAGYCREHLNGENVIFARTA